MAGKKDVILNFFEQLMQIAMSQEIYLHWDRQNNKTHFKGARCSIQTPKTLPSFNLQVVFGLRCKTSKFEYIYIFLHIQFEVIGKSKVIQNLRIA